MAHHKIELYKWHVSPQPKYMDNQTPPQSTLSIKQTTPTHNPTIQPPPNSKSKYEIKTEDHPHQNTRGFTEFVHVLEPKLPTLEPQWKPELNYQFKPF